MWTRVYVIRGLQEWVVEHYRLPSTVYCIPVVKRSTSSIQSHQSHQSHQFNQPQPQPQTIKSISRVALTLPRLFLLLTNVIECDGSTTCFSFFFSLLSPCLFTQGSPCPCLALHADPFSWRRSISWRLETMGEKWPLAVFTVVSEIVVCWKSILPPLLPPPSLQFTLLHILSYQIELTTSHDTAYLRL